jgi:hypothetical protein
MIDKCSYELKPVKKAVDGDGGADAGKPGDVLTIRVTVVACYCGPGGYFC